MSDSDNRIDLDNLWAKFAEKAITRKEFIQAALTAGISLGVIAQFLAAKASATSSDLGSQEQKSRSGSDVPTRVADENWNNFHNPFDQWDNWRDWNKEGGGWGNSPHG